MTFKEFMDKYKDNFEEIYLRTSYSSWRDKEKIIGCYIEWTIGGMTGGSCYGGELYPCSAEPEPEFEQLDSIFEKICPNITFLQYKKICQEIIREQEYNRNEYYGNYTEYKAKYFKAEDLFNALNQRNLL